MKQLTILLFFFIGNIQIFSQTYVPMPMQNCYWQMTHSKYCSQATGTPAISTSLDINKIYPYNDTIIATTKYVKFYTQSVSSTISSFCSIGVAGTGYFGAIRQDTLGKKIFLISPNQTNEQLLYNFNYIKGDSVKTVLGTYTSPPPGGDPYRIVDSIFYQSYSDGICRKTFRLKTYQYNGGGYVWTQHSYFTEGIGNEVGFNYRTYMITTSNINNASQEQWGSFLTINNSTISAVTSNTCSQTVGLKNNYYLTEIKVYPNPAQNEITISLGTLADKNYCINVFDLLGNKVLVSNNKTFKIDNLQNGTYIVKCFNIDTKETIVTKFIKD